MQAGTRTFSIKSTLVLQRFNTRFPWPGAAQFRRASGSQALGGTVPETLEFGGKVARREVNRLTRGAIPESDENLDLMQLIDEQYLRTPFWGSRKMAVFLSKRTGRAVNRKKTQRLMR